ncbi:MAG: glycosyltransferase [Acidobacteria bacterium]|nr:glycosyltransferase [Acidobacteriota bacterium]MBV9185734.1 glycosyltransferase [Acidobacteriota bacterium]
MKVSVIMPVERIGGDAERAIESVLRQEAPFPFELILVSAAPLATGFGTGVRNVIEPDRNPATRRNRAVSEAAGEILAFIDDDAIADAGWLATAVAYLDSHAEVLALGGPDPAPEDSTPAELIAETLLATPLIGSGVACHENRPGIFAITNASDVALVNLFIRKSAFRGFDEEIGYIGEDTSLVASLLPHVIYHSGVRVFHRRRAFPGPYLRQRWRYRLKTGEMLARSAPAYSKNLKIKAFLIVGAIAIIASPITIVPYYVFTLILGARTTRLPMRYWPMLPFAFAAHHATYFGGIVWGWFRARIFS